MNSDVYVQTVGATEPLRLTVSPTNAFGPAWSPDGSLIAYSQDVSGDHFDIMLIAPTGGQPRKVGELFYPPALLMYNGVQDANVILFLSAVFQRTQKK
jgi:hypothetical protein